MNLKIIIEMIKIRLNRIKFIYVKNNKIKHSEFNLNKNETKNKFINS